MVSDTIVSSYGTNWVHGGNNWLQWQKEVYDWIMYRFEKKLKKAFNTTNLKILLDKIQRYGIRGVVLNSYISNKLWFVQLGQYKSRLQYITCGVLQGSVLGPKLKLKNIVICFICWWNQHFFALVKLCWSSWW